MSEFTPGQWRYQAETKEVVYYEDGEEFVICDLSHMRTANADLNGKLLAAAQEMYEALTGLYQIQAVSIDEPWDDDRYFVAMEKAEAALKKARGE
jgi:hypothetical protein